MDVFPGWEDYVERIAQNWRAVVGPKDTVVLPGDFSWGMSLEEALPDFAYLEALPGHKILLKGNHDYWWTTRRKMELFFDAHGLNSLQILNNNSVLVEGIAVCGSRGWLFETGEPFDDKIIHREALRLEASIQDALQTGGEPVAFLHYPPIYGNSTSPQILEVLQKYGVRHCYYGHIHASGCRWAIEGKLHGIRFHLVSSDYRKFRPVLVTGI